MIRRIQALDYRCLRFVDIALGERQVLVGPNGSGKSALISAFTFLRDLVRKGPDAAVARHAGAFRDMASVSSAAPVAPAGDVFRDLVWRRPADEAGFELAVELELPEETREMLPEEKRYRTYRYEVALAGGEDGVAIRSERGILASPGEAAEPDQAYLFPDLPEPPATILTRSRAGARTVLSKSAAGMDRFYVEQDPRGWITDIALGPKRSALGNLPESSDTLPASTFAKGVLESAVIHLRPRPSAMRRPCSPAFSDEVLLASGTNLACVVRRLRGEHREAFNEWLALLCGALPGLQDIHVTRRKADRHRYLTLTYSGGLDIPSWLLSGGTLRLLALTLPAFLSRARGIYLVEGPERGIHPDALAALHASLFSMSGGQVIATTCSSALQQFLEPDEVLRLECGPDGATRVSRGPQATSGHAEDAETD